MNNFQKLEQERSKEYPNAVKNVKKRVDKTMNVYKFVGNIFDLYVPKIVGFVSVILGGDIDQENSSKYPNR